MVEFTLPKHAGTSTEFVNGAYSIDRILTHRMGDHDIIYGEGSACLDNSCCGNYVCSYVLIYGERILDAAHPEVLRARSIDDVQLTESIRQTFSRDRPGDTINFFQPVMDPRHISDPEPSRQPPCE